MQCLANFRLISDCVSSTMYCLHRYMYCKSRALVLIVNHNQCLRTAPIVMHLVAFFYNRYRDFYHTCYCLSGLSVSQHCHNTDTVQTITVDSESVLVSAYLHVKCAVEFNCITSRRN